MAPTILVAEARIELVGNFGLAWTVVRALIIGTGTKLTDSLVFLNTVLTYGSAADLLYQSPLKERIAVLAV